MGGRLLAAARGADDWLATRLGPTRVLFVLSDGYGFSCQAEVIRHLAGRPGVVVATTTDRPRPVDEIVLADPQEATLFRAHYQDPRRAAWRKWHMVVDTHRSAFYPKRHALRLFMHHGPGFGILGAKVAVAEEFDGFLGLSAIQRGIFERLRPGLFDQRHAFFAVGFPKDDPFARNTYDRVAILTNLGLDPRLPTLLITSHWQAGATLRCFRAAPFARLAEAGGWNVLQTGHPWRWRGRRGGLEPAWCEALVAELRAVEQRFPHARFLPDLRVEPLLAAADLLVADHSSVMTTYALRDRPIVWFDNPEFEFALPEIETIYRAATHPFTEIDGLVAACREALAAPAARAAGRRLMRDTFHANPGAAGSVAAAVIEEIGRCCRVGGRGWGRVLALSQRPDHRRRDLAG